MSAPQVRRVSAWAGSGFLTPYSTTAAERCPIPDDDRSAAPHSDIAAASSVWGICDHARCGGGIIILAAVKIDKIPAHKDKDRLNTPCPSRPIANHLDKPVGILAASSKSS